MKSKLIHLEKECQIKNRYKKGWNQLKFHFPNTEAMTFDIFMKEKFKKIDKQAERYTYYLFKSKNKSVLTAKNKHWLKLKYNK